MMLIFLIFSLIADHISQEKANPRDNERPTVQHMRHESKDLEQTRARSKKKGAPISHTKVIPFRVPSFRVTVSFPILSHTERSLLDWSVGPDMPES